MDIKGFTVQKVLVEPALDIAVELPHDEVREPARAADAVRDAANRYGFLRTAAFADGDHAFEHLRTFLAAFDDLRIHLNGVSRTELRDRFFQLLAVEDIDHVHDKISLVSNERIAGSEPGTTSA